MSSSLASRVNLQIGQNLKEDREICINTGDEILCGVRVEYGL